MGWTSLKLKITLLLKNTAKNRKQATNWQNTFTNDIFDFLSNTEYTRNSKNPKIGKQIKPTFKNEPNILRDISSKMIYGYNNK